MKGVPFFNKRYIKGVPFLPKWYIKGYGVGPPGGSINQSINQSINFNLNSHKHYFYSVEKEPPRIKIWLVPPSPGVRVAGRDLGNRVSQFDRALMKR